MSENEAAALESIIPDGYTDLAPGKLAAVVTYLEMTEFPPAPEPEPPADFRLRLVKAPDAAWYRSLFQRIGEPWLWFGRLRLADEELKRILCDPRVDVYALEYEGSDVGLLELDRRNKGAIELSYLGLSSSVIGKGAGRFLMDYALARVREHSPTRFWVHTCTLDHPSALAFYRRAGFIPYKLAIEVFDDPRLTGDLARNAAPHVPLIVP